MNAADYLLRRTSASTAPFLITEDGNLSFREFAERVHALSAYLRAHLPAGSRILLQAENCAFFAISYLAILKSGNVAVLLETRLAGEELEHIISQIQPAAFCRTQKMELDGMQMIDEAFLRKLPRLTQGGQSAPRKDHDIAHIIFTSGSTGGKKGVMITHANIRANTESILSYLRITEKDKTVVVLPFSYSYGLSLLHTHLRAGGSLILSRGSFLTGALDDIETHRATGLSGVPSTFEILIARGKFLDRSFPSLRYFTQAGGKMDPATILRIHEAFPRTQLFVMYGATEATTRLSYLPPRYIRTKLGSIGKGMKGVTMRIVDERGKALPRGREGEVIARGKNIMKGYFNDPAGTRAVIKRGWLHTGDLGYKDKDGFIFVTGRSKHIIKTAGYRISPYEIEHAFTSALGPCAVIGVPDQLRGEAIALFVEGQEDARKHSAIRTVTAQLVSHKVPSHIWFIASLPRTTSGKIDHPALRSIARTRMGTEGPTLDAVQKTPQYRLSSPEKKNLLSALTGAGVSRAAAHNKHIRSWFAKCGFDAGRISGVEDIPFLPVQLFKEFDLATVPLAAVSRILTSSGTTTAKKSMVPLDKATAHNQVRALTATLSTFLGGDRRPFFVIDHAGINDPAHAVSARTAGVRGLSIFARSTAYLLTDAEGALKADPEALKALALHRGKDVYLFGFTYIIWSVLYAHMKAEGLMLSLKNARLFHSGGWKRLANEKIAKSTFNEMTTRLLGIPPENIHEFYGMAEEGGVLFVDCSYGRKHAPDCAVVIIRDFHTLKPVPAGGMGLIEVATPLPESYYGHAVLTEDMGRLLGVDDCPCGRKGEYFEFVGRVPSAETRGCGDTFREV